MPAMDGKDNQWRPKSNGKICGDGKERDLFGNGYFEMRAPGAVSAIGK
jgi:hypothetical protein